MSTIILCIRLQMGSLWHIEGCCVRGGVMLLGAIMGQDEIEKLALELVKNQGDDKAFDSAIVHHCERVMGRNPSDGYEMVTRGFQYGQELVSLTKNRVERAPPDHVNSHTVTQPSEGLSDLSEEHQKALHGLIEEQRKADDIFGFDLEPIHRVLGEGVSEAIAGELGWSHYECPMDSPTVTEEYFRFLMGHRAVYHFSGEGGEHFLWWMRKYSSESRQSIIVLDRLVCSWSHMSVDFDVFL